MENKIPLNIARGIREAVYEAAQSILSTARRLTAAGRQKPRSRRFLAGAYGDVCGSMCPYPVYFLGVFY
jgi:hypothetical protein